MLLVERGSHYSEMRCGICHARLKEGDRILASYRHGEPRAIHAGACHAPRPAEKRAA